MKVNIREIGSELPEELQEWSDRSPHPWRRWLARVTDLLIAATLSLFLQFITPYIYHMTIGSKLIARNLVKQYIESASEQKPFNFYDTFMGYYDINLLITFLIAMIINAWLIGRIGFSFGKWLTGVKVLDINLKPLGFQQALRREWMVLFKGDAFGIPVMTYVTEILAYNRLNKEGITIWDRDLNCIVLHRSFTKIKIVCRCVGFWMVFMTAFCSIMFCAGLLMGFDIAIP